MSSPEQREWFANDVQPHEPALRAYLLRRFPDVPDHDDLIQDSFVRTLRARERGRLAIGKAYLFTAVRHAAIDWLRRRRAKPADPLPADEQVSALDPATAIPEHCDQEQRLAAAADAILGLPGRCREVMRLRYVEGLDTREIASRLGIAPETVRVQLFKGVQACIQHFEREGLIDTPTPARKP